MSQSRIAGSDGSCLFSFLRNLHTVFHSGCNQLIFPPTVWECSLFFTFSWAFVICKLYKDGHCDQGEVVLHCWFDLHFLIISDSEHLFMCLLAICMSSLEKCLFRFSAWFSIELFVFFVVVELYFWKLSPCRLHHL